MATTKDPLHAYKAPPPRLVRNTYARHRGTAASAFQLMDPTDSQEELPKECWEQIMKHFAISLMCNDNGIAAASRNMNIKWRKMHRKIVLEGLRRLIISMEGHRYVVDKVNALDMAHLNALGLLDIIE